MNAPLAINAKPTKTAMRLAVLETLVEEVGPSRNVRTPEACPVIAMAERVFEDLGIAREGWTLHEIATLMGLTEDAITGIERRALGRLRSSLRFNTEIVDCLRLLEALRDERCETLPEVVE